MLKALKNISLKRVTAGGKFIPEIDGLRFIAVTSVVLYHLQHFFVERNIAENYNPNFENTFFNHLLKQGNYGVEIFFVISGFILALPFIRIFSEKKGKLNLKNYFKRRLTRLEPPYFIIMIGLFILVVFGTKSLSLQEGLKSLGASLLYIHNFVYGLETLPLINGVAWSLEIEVQFYILAPLLGTIFLMKNKSQRRAIIVFVGVLFSVLGNTILIPFLSLFNFLEFFAVGFLLADLYIYRDKDKVVKIPFASIISLIILFTIFIIDPIEGNIAKYLVDFAQLGLLFVFFYGVLFLNSLPALRISWITNIGGMCYTIYLLNTYIISLASKLITKVDLGANFWLENTIYSIFILGTLLIVSSIFFLLVEKPCMDKNWPKKLKAFLTGKKYNTTT